MSEITPQWSDLFPSTASLELTSPRAGASYDLPDERGYTCLVWDEAKEQIEQVANDHTAAVEHHTDVQVLSDTDAFARQGDKGPYHWAQGPLDNVPYTASTPPPPPAEPAKPGALPVHGNVITTSNLRMRVRPDPASPAYGVIPAGSLLSLTGARRRRPDGTLWVRCKYDADQAAEQTGQLRRPDRWLDEDEVGWVNSTFLAVPAMDWAPQDFPPVTHEWRWNLADTMDVPKDDAQRTLQAIFDDPRGPRRAGLLVTHTDHADEANVVVSFTPNPCNGAAGCYYKRSGQVARAEIGRDYWGSSWLSRVAIHEVIGHGACRCYDHYRGAPDYPRSEYSGIMGNWTDAFGDHAWPDADDVENWIEWLAGQSPYVFVRDTSVP